MAYRRQVMVNHAIARGLEQLVLEDAATRRGWNEEWFGQALIPGDSSDESPSPQRRRLH